MVISVKNLTKQYRVYKKQPGIPGSIRSLFSREYVSVQAVDDVSFTVDRGELVGFTGPNGAGKTTTLKCLSGILYPTSGDISVLGYTPFDRKTEFLKKISLVMGQKNQLWWDLPAAETFVLNKEIYGVSDASYKKTLSELVELLDVSRLLSVPVRKLSLGERMKMELIAALIHKPEILFLDEPTIGLDVIMQKKMRDFISEYNKRHESTILLTSHYMEDVKQLATRVIIIDRGRIMYDGKLDRLVKKYTKHKVLTLVLEKDIGKDVLSRIAQISSYEFPKAVLTVERNQVKQVAVKLLSDIPIEDLTISEQDIEDTIRDVFTGNREHS